MFSLGLQFARNFLHRQMREIMSLQPDVSGHSRFVTVIAFTGSAYLAAL